MRRTTTAARKAVKDLPLTHQQRERLEEMIAAVEEEDKATARESMLVEVGRFRSKHAEVMPALDEVQSGMDALIAEGQAGTISARDYAARFKELEGRRVWLEQRARDLQSSMAAVERMEKDPVGYVDELRTKYNKLREWPF